MNPPPSASPRATKAAVGRRVVRNTTLLSLGEIITLATMTPWTIIMARYVGPETYGFYAYSQALLAILVVFINAGLDQLLTRDVAQDRALGLPYLISFFLLKSFLAALVLGSFVAYVFWSGGPADRMTITLIVTGMWLLQIFTASANALLYAHESMHYGVIAQGFNSTLTLLTGAVAVWLQQPFFVVLWLSLAASAVQLILALYFIGRLHSWRRVRLAALVLPRAAMFALLKKASPFALAGLITVLYSNAMVLFLRQLTSDDKSVGYMAAAQRIYSMTLLVPSSLFSAIFPAFSNAYTSMPAPAFAAMFERAYRYVFFITVPMAFGLWVIAPMTLELIYGRDFAPAAPALQILALILLTAVGYVMGPAMGAMHKQTAHSIIYGVSLIAMLAVGYWAIPLYGVTGAALAQLGGSVFSFVVHCALMFRWLHLRYPLGWTAKTLLASALMAWTVQALSRELPFLLVALIFAPLVYVTILLVLRTLSADDWSHVNNLLPKPVRQALDPMFARRGLDSEQA